MLKRQLEPEVMDTVEETVDYDSMDHSHVNRLFVDDFLQALQAADRNSGAIADDGRSANALRILDVGTGTAQIPIELCRRSLRCHVTAIDLAGEMLKLARENVAAAGLDHDVTLECVDAKNMGYHIASFDAVISNSIVHHIPEPARVLAEMIRVVRPGGLLFVRDLMRPPDLETLDHLVATYAGDENDHQQQMFRDSLHAALALNEVEELLERLNQSLQSVAATSDRHWTINTIVR